MNCGSNCISHNFITIYDAKNNSEHIFYSEFEQKLMKIGFEVSKVSYKNDQPPETVICGYIAICCIVELIYSGSISREILFGEPEATVNFFNSIIFDWLFFGGIPSDVECFFDWVDDSVSSEYLELFSTQYDDYFEQFSTQYDDCPPDGKFVEWLYCNAFPLSGDEIHEVIKVLEFIMNGSHFRKRGVRAAKDWYQSHRSKFNRKAFLPSLFAGVFTREKFIDYAKKVAKSTQGVEHVAIIHIKPSSEDKHWFAVKIGKYVEQELPSGPSRTF